MALYSKGVDVVGVAEDPRVRGVEGGPATKSSGLGVVLPPFAVLSSIPAGRRAGQPKEKL